MDRPGKYLYLKDTETNDIWSPTWQPVQTKLDEYECRIGFGYNKISALFKQVKTKLDFLVASSAISLLASGHSSSTVGTMAGQIIMQGFIHRKIPMWIRRLMTMLPSFVVIGLRLDPTNTLVLSQVILSFGLPFAIIPLVVFSSDKKLMGVLVNRRITTIVAWIVAALIVALNLFLLYETIWGGGAP